MSFDRFFLKWIGYTLLFSIALSGIPWIFPGWGKYFIAEHWHAEKKYSPGFGAPVTSKPKYRRKGFFPVRPIQEP